MKSREATWNCFLIEHRKTDLEATDRTLENSISTHFLHLPCMHGTHLETHSTISTLVLGDRRLLCDRHVPKTKLRHSTGGIVGLAQLLTSSLCFACTLVKTSSKSSSIGTIINLPGILDGCYNNLLYICQITLRCDRNRYSSILGHKCGVFLISF